MEKDIWGKLEKACKRGIAVILVVTVILAIRIGLMTTGDTEKNQKTEEIQGLEKNPSLALTNEIDYAPANYSLYDTLPNFSFTNEEGKQVTLKDLEGRLVILNFWASWCPDCQREMERADDIQTLLSKYDDVSFFVVDRLEGTKETKEKATTYMTEHQIPFPLLFDEEKAVYKALGLKVIPTVLVLDDKGVLKACINQEELDLEKLEAIIQLEIEGREEKLLRFITEELTRAGGGIATNYKEERSTLPSGEDVLSESQGLLMEYAVNKKNKILFETAWYYVKEHMLIDKLAAWVVTEKKASRVNAVLDDLRIYKALYEADKLWGGYRESLEDYQKALYKYNTQNESLVDFYDFKFKQKAERITLCNIDFEALARLQQTDERWQGVLERGIRLVEEGWIGEDFPLYYSWYDYDKKAYAQDEIHTAEAMMTLLHLAQIGQIEETSLEWIRQEIDGKGILARYHVDGTVVEGYDYESTAIYAITALIGEAVGDEEIRNKSLTRMEKYQVVDANSSVNGIFGEKDGKEVYSFDQLMALKAYERLRDREVYK